MDQVCQVNFDEEKGLISKTCPRCQNILKQSDLRMAPETLEWFYISLLGYRNPVEKGDRKMTKKDELLHSASDTLNQSDPDP